jgi:ABC-2 type transport system permease protein
MTKVWFIAWHEYLTNVRRVGFILFTLLPPVFGLIGLVIAAFFSGQATDFLQSQFGDMARPVGVVDQSQLFTPIPAEFAERYRAFPDEASAKQALMTDALSAYVVIPSDYVATGEVTAYSQSRFGAIELDDSDSLRALLVQGLLAGKVDATTLARAGQPLEVTPITLDENGQPTTTANPVSTIMGFIVPYVVSIFLSIAVFVAANYLLRSVGEEKETRVIEIVMSSVSAAELLAGKVIGLGALGLTQLAAWVAASFALSGGAGALLAGVVVVLSPTTFLLAVVYFVLGYLVYGITMAAAGSLGTNMRESQQLAGFFTFAASIPWMINGFLWANPNMVLARVLSYIPFTAPTMMLLRLPIGQVPAVDIVGSIAVLVLSVPVILWAGAKIFRAGLLMYGKRPNLKQIVALLRQA